jgi:hypothetical protein
LKVYGQLLGAPRQCFFAEIKEKHGEKKKVSTRKNPPKLAVVGALAPPADRPPHKLGKPGQKLWDAICSEYVFDDAAGKETLYHICAAADLVEPCAEQVRRDGAVVRSKGGIVREHPALRPQQAARSFIVRTLAKLGIGAEPVQTVGRPPSGYGFRGYE